jgi:hypothetical protein
VFLRLCIISWAEVTHEQQCSAWIKTEKIFRTVWLIQAGRTNNRIFLKFVIIRDICARYLEPQVEQLVAEQPPQEELAVLLNFPPLENAKADITR